MRLETKAPILHQLIAGHHIPHAILTNLLINTMTNTNMYSYLR